MTLLVTKCKKRKATHGTTIGDHDEENQQKNRGKKESNLYIESKNKNSYQTR